MEGLATMHERHMASNEESLRWWLAQAATERRVGIAFFVGGIVSQALMLAISLTHGGPPLGIFEVMWPCLGLYLGSSFMAEARRSHKTANERAMHSYDLARRRLEMESARQLAQLREAVVNLADEWEGQDEDGCQAAESLRALLPNV